MIKDIDDLSPAEKSGLKPGDKILKVNEKNVEDIVDYQLILDLFKNDGIRKDEPINLTVMNAVEYNVFKSNRNTAKLLHSQSESHSILSKTSDSLNGSSISDNEQEEGGVVHNELKKYFNKDSLVSSTKSSDDFDPQFTAIPPPPHNFQANQQDLFNELQALETESKTDTNNNKFDFNFDGETFPDTDPFKAYLITDDSSGFDQKMDDHPPILPKRTKNKQFIDVEND
jgi:hypothetical protein